MGVEEGKKDRVREVAFFQSLPLPEGNSLGTSLAVRPLFSGGAAGEAQRFWASFAPVSHFFCSIFCNPHFLESLRYQPH